MNIKGFIGRSGRRRNFFLLSSCLACVVCVALVARVVGSSALPTTAGLAAANPTATSTSSNNAVTLFNQAEVLRNGHCDQAIPLYLQAVQLNPMYVAAYRALGYCYQSQEVGKLNSSILYYGKALQIDPTNYGIYLDRAGVELNNGNTGEAIADTLQSLHFAPAQAPAYMSIAQRFDSLTDLADEVQAIGRAIEIAPTNPQYYLAQATVYIEMGDPGRGVQDYYHALQVAPYAGSRASTYASLADVYSSQQDYSDAYRAIDEAIKVQPDNADYYRRSGDIRQANGEFTSALSLYTRALRGEHGSAAEPTYASIGSTYVKLNNSTKAYQAYSQAAKLVFGADTRTKLSQALADLADFYMTVPDIKNAYKFSNLALSVSPNNVSLLIRAAAVHRQAGDFTGALSLDDKAVKHAIALSDLEVAHEDRGDTLFLRGEMGQAAAEFNTAKRLTTDQVALSRLNSKLKATGH